MLVRARSKVSKLQTLRTRKSTIPISEFLFDIFVRVGRLFVFPWLLSFGKFELFARGFFIRYFAEQMRDAIQAGTAFVVRADDIPRCPGRIRGGKHFVAGTRIVVPAAIGIEVHGRQLPSLAA